MSLEEFTSGDFSEGLIWAGKMFQAEKMEGTGKEELGNGWREKFSYWTEGTISCIFSKGIITTL